MIFKILKEYIRRISRNYRIYAISILGMSIAVIASFHIYHFVYKELRVDKFHENRKELYRLVNTHENSSSKSTQTFLPLGPILKEKMPEVKDFVRMTIHEEAHRIKGANDQETQATPKFVDPSFFEVFNFNLIEGSLAKFKDTPHGIIISEKASRQLFGNESPIGKPLTISKYRNTDEWSLEIVGVMQNMPKESTIQGDYFININSLEILVGEGYKQSLWNFMMVELYIHAPNIKDLKEFTEKVKDITLDQANLIRNPNYPMKRVHLNIQFQRMDDIYFNSLDVRGQQQKGSFQFLKIILLIGILTLLLAITNYIIMNLGLSISRADEFRIKRYSGATKQNIFYQFIIESFINAFICFFIAMITYPILSDFMGELIGFEYRLTFKNDLLLILTFFTLMLLLGFIIGAFQYLLSYKNIFSEQQWSNRINSWSSKRIMICFQLCIFIALIIGVTFIGKQVNYIEQKDIGFKFDNVLGVIPAEYGEALKNELTSKSYVKGIAGGETLFKTEYRLSDITIKTTQEKVKSIVVLGDANYLDVYDIKLLYGKTLNPSKLQTFYNWTGQNAQRGLVEVLVNEEFVKKANLKNPIGTALFVNSNSVIVGVFKNINNTPLYDPIQPIIIGYNFSFFTPRFQVRFEEGYKDQVIADINSVYKKHGVSFDYYKNFIEYIDYKDIYKKEFQLKQLLEAFTIIVLFISLLGLVAISLFITESKTKEIGIRKINGASIKEIMIMLNKDFIKWVLIAFAIACPMAYYAMSKWLESFAYKTALSWWVFAIAGAFTLIIALLTVSWQTYRAATQNPVESLRDE